MNQEKADEIIFDAELIIDELGEMARFGDKYSDFLSKLIISRKTYFTSDTYTINIYVSKYLGFKKQTVFSYEKTENVVDIFREGLWIQYLKDIAKKAQKHKEIKEAIKKQKESKYFVPIDDEEIFPQYKAGEE